MKLTLSILFFCLSASAQTPEIRAQAYLRARLAKMHTGHAPQFYVRDIDASFPNLLAELSCRISEVKPDTRVLIWTKTEKEGICQAHGCAARLPMFPNGQFGEKTHDRPVRLFAYGISNRLERSTRTRIIIKNEIGAWSGPIVIQVLDAPTLEKYFR